MRKLSKLFGLVLIGRMFTRYIDPNTGGMLFQFLAVIFALLSTAFFFFSAQIKAGFARIKRVFRERDHNDQMDISDVLPNGPEDQPDTGD